MLLKNEEIIKLLSESKPIYEPTSLEFKKATDISESLLETVSAFANSDGGNIILGVHRSSGEPLLKYIGIESSEKQESKIRDKFRNEMKNLTENLSRSYGEHNKSKFSNSNLVRIARLAGYKT